MPGDETHERLRSALSDLAASNAAELLDQARVEASERVLALLVDALSDATLERVYELLGEARASRSASPPAVPEPAIAPEPDSAPEPLPQSALGWYVYGVVGAADRKLPALPGIDPEHPITVLSHGQLAAVVSRVPLAEFDEEPLRDHLADMQWLERTARTHEQVLERLGERATLIPMRMCSVYRDDAGVLVMLERESDAFSAALSKLRGKTEWGVKVFVDHDAAERGRRAAGHDAEPHGQGTAYLRERQSERREVRQRDSRIGEACHEIHARLSSLSDDSLVSPLQRPEVSGHPGEMVLNGVYLVDDRARERLDAAIEALGATFAPLGLELLRTGPWPAYNFVPGTIGAAW